MPEIGSALGTLAQKVPTKYVAWAAIIALAAFSLLVFTIVASVVFGFDFKIAGLEFGRNKGEPHVGELPDGAVVAFDLPNGCPDSWVPFTPAADKFIVGAGEKHRLYYDKGMPVYDTGGTPSIQVAFENLPEHTHGLNYLRFRAASSPQAPPIPLVRPVGADAPRNTWTTGMSGQPSSSERSKPIETLPPYIALHVCFKGKLLIQETAQLP